MADPTPLKEGSRWRHAKPSSEEVAAWFKSVPLDEGLDHADYIAGVVLIPASEKVKRATERGTTEVWEQTFTPYVRVDTRVSYFRKLAEVRGLVAVIEPVSMPRIAEGAFRNENMPEGFWWHIAGEQASAERFLCCTMRVALYDTDAWTSHEPQVIQLDPDRGDGPIKRTFELPRPLREGVATKQVSGKPDPNGLAKAETGAIGRALGIAGILVVGTGIATAEDMQEYRAEQGAAVLPEAGAVADSDENVNERIVALQGRLRRFPEAWREFAAWWRERSKESGWNTVMDAPVEVRRGMVAKMEALAEAAEAEAPQQDSSSPEEVPSGS